MCCKSVLPCFRVLQEMKKQADPDDIELLTVAIKSDANEKFPSLNLIIETLRNQKQNKFSFVTGLKAD